MEEQVKVMQTFICHEKANDQKCLVERVCGTWCHGVNFKWAVGSLSPLCSTGCGMCDRRNTGVSKPSVFVYSLTDAYTKRTQTKTSCYV